MCLTKIPVGATHDGSTQGSGLRFFRIWPASDSACNRRLNPAKSEKIVDPTPFRDSPCTPSGHKCPRDAVGSARDARDYPQETLRSQYDTLQCPADDRDEAKVVRECPNADVNFAKEVCDCVNNASEPANDELKCQSDASKCLSDEIEC